MSRTRIFGWVLAVLLIVITWRAAVANLGDIQITSIDVTLLASSLCLLIVGQAIRSTLGWTVARSLGFDLTLGASYRAWHLSQLAKYLPGGIWVFPARADLYKRDGIPLGVGAAMTITEIAAVVGSGAFLAAALGVRFYTEHAELLASAAVTSLLAMVAVTAPPLWKLAAQRGMNGAAEIRDRLSADKRLPARLAANVLIINFVSWLLIGVGFWMLVRGLGHEVTVTFATFAFVTAWVVGFVVVIAPGGIGPREAVLTALLASDIPSGSAFALVLIARVWWMASEAAHAGLASATVWRRRKHSSAA